MEPTTSRSFSRSYLPWALAAGMLLLYFVTLNKHVTYSSVLSVARWSGLDWHPTYVAPLTWLLSLPVRWLSPSSQLLALNFLGALCAVLTLALLARSVMLLPHDRTHDQRLREENEHALLTIRTAWIPPLFAVLLLGLQRTFWENAIIFTGEAVDVLLIAYVIRCLLEFRVDGRDSWLWKMAFVYGLGMTNDFAFIAYAPAMLVAVIWLKKLKFFEYAFLMRLLGFGLLGLSLYLLLPIVQSLNDAAESSFWTTLRINLGYQKQFIIGYQRWRAFWLGGYPLMMLLVIAVRWSSGWGDTSRIGGYIGTALAHLLHIALLALAVYMAFELPASPRNLGLGLAFLGSYYMGALAAGYIVGYLLLVFSDFSTAKKRPPGPGTVPSSVMVPLSYLVSALVFIAVIAVPAKLVHDNWPRITALNEPQFRDYAAHLAASLPKEPAVVMSDDAVRLYAVALLTGAKQGHVFVETHSLTNASYLRLLKHRHSGMVPDLPPDAQRTPVSGYATLSLLNTIRQKHELIYLHPSFGYFFESFYLEPRQLVYRLQPYPSNTIEAPTPSAALIAEQKEMWNRLSASVLRPLEASVNALRPQDQVAHSDMLFAAQSYSLALDWWAVELQRAGQLDDAMPFLDEAVALNPNNASAFITREANIAWRKTHKRLEELSQAALAKMKTSAGIEPLMNSCGPVDEPSFQTEIMQLFARSGLWRQAAQHIYRAMAFAPNEPGYQVALANIFLGWGRPERALEVIQETRQKHAQQSLTPAVAVDLARTEAAGHFATNDFAGAEVILKRAKDQYRDQDAAYLALAQLYVSQADALKRAGKVPAANQMLTNAVAVGEDEIRQQPQNPSSYFNHGNLCMYLPDYDRAIQSYTKVLEFDPKNFAALLNRAIANLLARKLDDAQQDYQKLLTFTTTSFKVYYGLAEVAYEKKDWSHAAEYYKRYLDYAPANSEETQIVKAKLAEVKKK